MLEVNFEEGTRQGGDYVHWTQEPCEESKNRCDLWLRFLILLSLLDNNWFVYHVIFIIDN